MLGRYNKLDLVYICDSSPCGALIFSWVCLFLVQICLAIPVRVSHCAIVLKPATLLFATGNNN